MFCHSEIADLKKEVQDLKIKVSNQASFAVTTGIELVKMERELSSARAHNIKLKAYTRRSNILLYGVQDSMGTQEDTGKVLKKTSLTSSRSHDEMWNGYVSSVSTESPALWSLTVFHCMVLFFPREKGNL